MKTKETRGLMHIRMSTFGFEKTLKTGILMRTKDKHTRACENKYREHKRDSSRQASAHSSISLSQAVHG
jgi:hypothetical protein